MAQFKFTKQILDFDENQEPISAIEEIIGRSLEEDEILEFDTALCNGEECPTGYTCILGNCVKDDVPEPGNDG